MQPDFYQQYRDLCKSLTSIRASVKSEMAKVEECFSTALHQWSSVRKWVEEHFFDDQKAEIIFFKEIKPMFTSAIEYCVMEYGSLLFCPSGDRESLRYWKSEEERVSQFFSGQRSFCTYYLSGNTRQDALYFVRQPENAGCKQLPRSYPDGVRSSSSHDHLVTLIKARGKYLQHIRMHTDRMEIKSSRTKPAADVPPLSYPSCSFADTVRKPLTGTGIDTDYGVKELYNGVVYTNLLYLAGM